MPLSELSLAGAELAYDPGFLAPAEADAAFIDLQSSIAWERHRIRLFGREHLAPRLSCWIGDPGADYRYSRTRFTPRPWPPALLALRLRLETALAERFNAVLANLYRDGADAMGWHADDEPELGPRPVVASLSLGASRRFLLRGRAAGAEQLALNLTHGSLLLMRGETQRNYRHALPRALRCRQPRLNLTFRNVLTLIEPAAR